MVLERRCLMMWKVPAKSMGDSDLITLSGSFTPYLTLNVFGEPYQIQVISATSCRFKDIGTFAEHLGSPGRKFLTASSQV